MKINSDILVFDLEATSGKDVLGFQTNNFIIDIGAVYLNSKLDVVDTYSSLVKPEEYITEYIEKLTGISNAMVDNERYFDAVGVEFAEWVRKLAPNGNIKNVMLCAWGNYFDIPLLRKLYQKYRMEYPFLGSALDVRTIAFAWLALSGRRTDKSSVEHVAKEMGIAPDGAYHRAIVDAKAQALILQRAMRDLDRGVFIEVAPGKTKHFTIVEA